MVTLDRRHETELTFMYANAQSIHNIQSRYSDDIHLAASGPVNNNNNYGPTLIRSIYFSVCSNALQGCGHLDWEDGKRPLVKLYG